MKKRSLKKSAPADCISRSKIPLKLHQKKVIKFISEENNNSLLVVHFTGLGKTLSALVASQCYIDQFPNNNIVVISPASLIDNFKKESIKYGSRLTNRYKFFSFDSVSKADIKDYKNSMVIIDEVHGIRNMKSRYNAVFNCAKNSHKLLLLTATPFVNSLLDFKCIINLLYRDNKILEKNFKFIRDVRPSYDYNQEFTMTDGRFMTYVKPNGEYKKVLDNIAFFLDKKVSFEDQKNSVYFPRVFIHKVEMYMTKNFYEKYIKMLSANGHFGKSPEKFYTGYRQAVNAVGNEEYIGQKIDKIYEILKRKEQTLIFTNWIENGINILINFF